MLKNKNRNKNIINILYHILIFILSATIALSLPYTGKFIADNYLTYWALIESEKSFLISVEVIVAVLLIVFFKYLVMSWKDRKLSKIALHDLGLVLAAPSESHRSKKRLKEFKKQQGGAKDVLLLGSTGWNTFTDPESDMHHVIQNCREAKILLLNPFGEGASVRAKSIPDSDVTPEYLREKIVRSIDFLKHLKDQQKNIRLKLYDETPLFKLTVLGDYIFLKYYNLGLNVQQMSEYIFRHSAKQSSLFHPLYQYFLSKWRDPNIPEYDLDSDELIYRDDFGNEVKREKLDGMSIIASMA